MRELSVRDLGLIEYNDALKIQEKIFNDNISAKNHQQTPVSILLIAEHFPVYTLGKHANTSHLLNQMTRIPVVPTGRGGDITYHGPGQIVLYPILHLEAVQWGLAKYVTVLEQTGIKLCAAYGIEAGSLQGKNGVWIEGQRKIMAIGIKASRHITMHGLAFNVNTSLAPYHDIVPCGIRDKAVTSLAAELGREISFQEAKEKMVQIFTALWQE